MLQSYSNPAAPHTWWNMMDDHGSLLNIRFWHVLKVSCRMPGATSHDPTGGCGWGTAVSPKIQATNLLRPALSFGLHKVEQNSMALGHVFHGHPFHLCRPGEKLVPNHIFKSLNIFLCNVWCQSIISTVYAVHELPCKWVKESCVFVNFSISCRSNEGGAVSNM